ncbi:hypothetical protein BD309DRAFT_1085216 [Dichomitus squalens]|nr:hypothetical protein BD309DRAFT_1085216 [Dichomitus squalens]
MSPHRCSRDVGFRSARVLLLPHTHPPSIPTFLEDSVQLTCIRYRITTAHLKMWSSLRVLLTTTLDSVRAACSSGFVFYGNTLLNLGNYLQDVETLNASTGLELLDILFFAGDDVTTDGLLLVFMRRVPIVILIFTVFALLFQACLIMRYIAWATMVLSFVACISLLRLVVSLGCLGVSVGEITYHRSCLAGERLQGSARCIFSLVASSACKALCGVKIKLVLFSSWGVRAFYAVASRVDGEALHIKNAAKGFLTSTAAFLSHFLDLVMSSAKQRWRFLQIGGGVGALPPDVAMKGNQQRRRRDDNPRPEPLLEHAPSFSTVSVRVLPYQPTPPFDGDALRGTNFRSSIPGPSPSTKFHLNVSGPLYRTDTSGEARRKLVLRLPLNVFEDSQKGCDEVSIIQPLATTDLGVECRAPPLHTSRNTDSPWSNVKSPMPSVYPRSPPGLGATAHNGLAPASDLGFAHGQAASSLLSPRAPTSHLASPCIGGLISDSRVFTTDRSVSVLPPSESTVQALIRKIEGMDPEWPPKPSKPALTRAELQARIDEICGVDAGNSIGSSRSTLSLASSSSASGSCADARRPPRTSKATNTAHKSPTRSRKIAAAQALSSSSSSTCACSRRKIKSPAYELVVPRKIPAKATAKPKTSCTSAPTWRAVEFSSVDAGGEQDKSVWRKLTGRQRQEKTAREAAMGQ